MKNVLVVGTGPVGLATADRISQAGPQTYLIDFSRPATDDTKTDSNIERVTKTYPAAAAFWTPFSSGISPQSQKDISKLTLEFYSQFKDTPDNPAGIRWRDLEQHWVQGAYHRPPWLDFEELEEIQLPNGVDYCVNESTKLQTRCEVKYKTPTIDVEKFRRWYKAKLNQRKNVSILQDCNTPFISSWHAIENIKGINEWKNLIIRNEIDTIILCTGASTRYLDLYDNNKFPNQAFNFKKGVIARIPSTPSLDEPILLYEGTEFNIDALYLVPYPNYYVLGGTITSTQSNYAKSDWEANDLEINGIKERAAQYLPKKQTGKLKDAGLWETPGKNNNIEWRVGVRPMIDIKGPEVLESTELSNAISNRTERPISVYTHFGHGGSGFTFCQDTAKQVADVLTR